MAGAPAGVACQVSFEVVVVEGVDADAGRIRRLLQRSTHARFEVHRCRDLSTARTVLRESCPDCVLLDLDLPDSCSLRTLSHVLSVTSAPVVVLSNGPTANARQHALANSAIGFLSKDTLSSEALSAAVMTAIDQQERLIELRAQTHCAAAPASRHSTALRDATVDPLTGVLSHHALVAVVDHELHDPQHAVEVLGVVHVEVAVDGGGPIDEATLRAAAQRMTSVLRPADHIGRNRGPEIVIVSPHLPDRDALAAVSQRVVASLDTPVETPQGPRQLRATVGHGAVTIGHACVVAPPLPQLLLTSAEIAMREARATP